MDRFSCLLGAHLGAVALGPGANPCLGSRAAAPVSWSGCVGLCFQQQCTNLPISPYPQEQLLFSTKKIKSHQSGREAASHCGFDVCFPNDRCRRTSLPAFLGHVYVSGETSIRVLCPFKKKWVVCLFAIEFFMYSGC